MTWKIKIAYVDLNYKNSLALSAPSAWAKRPEYESYSSLTKFSNSELLKTVGISGEIKAAHESPSNFHEKISPSAPLPLLFSFSLLVRLWSLSLPVSLSLSLCLCALGSRSFIQFWLSVFSLFFFFFFCVCSVRGERRLSNDVAAGMTALVSWWTVSFNGCFCFCSNCVQHYGSRNSMILYFLHYFIFLAIPIYYFIVSAMPKIIFYTDQKTMEGRVFFVGNIYMFSR